MVEAALRDDTILVSVMHVNNEIGTINDITAIGELTRSRGILFHVDAAQSTGKVEIDLEKMKVDLMSFSAHKTYGPKGVGALYVRRKPRVRLEAQMHGGGHERGMRSGTLATHQLVGMGEAFHLAKLEMAQENERIRALRDRFYKQVEHLEELYVNGSMTARVPHNLNLSFNYVEGESLIMALKDLAVSSGSACTSASLEPSYVLRALGRNDELAHSSIRFSFGRFTTEEEIDYAAQKVCEAVTKLRELSPLWDMFKDGVDISNVGKFDAEDPSIGTGMVGAPACGDVMRLQIKVNEQGVIEDAKFKTYGCGSAIASSSLATEWMKGKTLEEAETIKNTQLAEELALPPVKIHCSVLAEDAIKAAVRDYREKKGLL